MSHKKFGPDRFSRFDVYWIQTNKQTDKPNLYIEEGGLKGEGGGYKNELSGKYNSPAWNRSNNIPSNLFYKKIKAKYFMNIL